jgi:hypothetical protein
MRIRFFQMHFIVFTNKKYPTVGLNNPLQILIAWIDTLVHYITLYNTEQVAEVT